VYYKRVVQLKVGEQQASSATATPTQLHVDRDRELVNTTLNAIDTGIRSVPAATNAQVDLGGVATPRAVYIEYAGALKLRFQQAGEAVPLSPLTGTTGVFFAEIAPGELWLENEDAEDAVEVFVAVAGTIT